MCLSTMKSNRGGRRGVSLQSVAQSLSASHQKQQQPNRRVTVKDSNPAERLRAGRHRCDCQARIHGLIRNCMGCGRIVCEQEGSGPCFSCGELVCTREERQILNRNSKKSAELYGKLMAGNDANELSGKSSSGEPLSLAALGNALSKAEEFKNRLLTADADRERQTHVHDLESDYYNMENNAYLTKEEREAIIARKEELKQMRARQKRALIVDFDLDKRTVSETKDQHEYAASDPVIQSIISKSHQRQQQESGVLMSRPNFDSLFPSFTPKYDERYGHRSKNVQGLSDDERLEIDDMFLIPSEEMLYAEVERKGYAIPVQQPLASLLAVGIRRHIPWPEDVDLRGPLFIAATARAATQAEIRDEVQKCRDLAFQNVYGEADGGYGGLDREYPLSYPSGAIVGRAMLMECLSLAEYVERYPQGECADSQEGFVLIFKVFDPLLVPIPHLPPQSSSLSSSSQSHELYTINKQLRTAIKHILDPYSFS